MFISRTVHIGVLWYTIWFWFVKSGNSRDTIYQAILETQPIYVVSYITEVLNTAIADSIMVSFPI